MPSTRSLALVFILATLLLLPAGAQARPRILPVPAGPPHSSPTPRPPAPPVDGALLGSGGLILVAVLGCAGRAVTRRLA
jgi:hypothetical protein